MSSFFDQSTDQSRVKAAIVANYFWAWAKVVMPVAKNRHDPRIAYIDLFTHPVIALVEILVDELVAAVVGVGGRVVERRRAGEGRVGVGQHHEPVAHQVEHVVGDVVLARGVGRRLLGTSIVNDHTTSR